MWEFASSQFNQVNYNFYDKAQRRKQEHQTTKGAAMRAEKVEFVQVFSVLQLLHQLDYNQFGNKLNTQEA